MEGHTKRLFNWIDLQERELDLLLEGLNPKTTRQERMVLIAELCEILKLKNINRKQELRARMRE